MAISKEDVAQVLLDACWYLTREEAEKELDEMIANGPDAKRFVWFFGVSLAAINGDKVADAMIDEFRALPEPTSLDEFRAMIDDVSSRHRIKE